MTEALVWYGDKIVPEKLLSLAPSQTCAFGAICEINEAEVQHHPWFSTDSANFVSAVNKMLLHNRENGELHIAPSVPKKWTDYSFKLPTFGGYWLDAKIAGVKLASIRLSAGEKAEKDKKFTLVVPSQLVDKSKISVPFPEQKGEIRIDVIGDKPFYK